MSIFRTFWAILVSLAILGVILISLQLSDKFNSSPLSTVVESTIYPVAEIPYPSITICPNNRLSVERCKEAEKIFLPKNATKREVEVFRLLLLGLNNIEFGAMDEFYEDIFEISSAVLNKINLTELFEFTMLTCEEIFTGKCWWRNKYFNCCTDDFIHKQKTEYGICFAFNSAVNEIGIEKDVRGKMKTNFITKNIFQENKSVHFPYRTSNYGDWSGFRVEMSPRSDIAINEQFKGIQLLVQHPLQWPNTGKFL